MNPLSARSTARRSILLQLFAVLCLAATPSKAAEITFVITGTVVNVDAELAGTISLGDPVVATYSFESTTPDLNSATNRGQYGGAITAASMSIGGYVATGTSGEIAVRNDHPNVNPVGSDDYSAIAFPLTGDLVDAYVPEYADLVKLTGQMFSSDALPTTPPTFPNGEGVDFMALQFVHINCIDPGPGNSTDCSNMPDNEFAGVSASVSSVDIQLCGDGAVIGAEACDDGAANGTVGSCCSSTCTIESAGTTCRAAAGLCDVAESCDGASAACPVDAFAPATTECRAADGVCDAAELCTGSSASCPADAKVPAATECRAASGVCDVTEVCDGASNDCPVDAFASALTECRGANGVCDLAETCTGASGACPADSFAPNTTECRGAAGACDVAEQCTGSSPSCPADAKVPAATECRATNGVCDVAEVCDGASSDCPADGFASASTECRGSNGVCDVAETCTGAGAACPADGFAPNTTECRGAAGACDVAEQCTGSSASCPADAKVPAATECRTANGVCDVAEACDGTSNDCPEDAFASSSTECRAANGACDVAEQCEGSTAACPADAFASDTTECRAANGACDVAETCDGSTAACPADAFASAATECRAADGACDVAETCDGSTAECPADAFEPATTECRAASGVCDVAESCSGTDAACPADAKSTDACRASADQCDATEVCDGVGDDCPADLDEPDGTVCDDGDQDTIDDMCAAGLCMGEFSVCGNGLVEIGEACDDGNTSDGDCCSATCAFEAAGNPCEDGIACTAGDTCDGAGACQTGGPATSCVSDWPKANLLVKENKPGRESIKVKLKGGPALTQAAFGNPETGSTVYDLCLFDEFGGLAAALSVDRAGELCDGKPCWAAKKDTGWQYKDKAAASDGVTKAKLFGGAAGKTQIQFQAANNDKKGLAAMPLGIAAALQGSATATIQLLASDGACFEATIDEIKKQEQDFFKGLAK